MMCPLFRKNLPSVGLQMRIFNTCCNNLVIVSCAIILGGTRRRL